MKKSVVILLALVLALSSCAGPEKVSDKYRNYYEIFVRSYYDTDSNGLGDLDGVTAKLDYIAKDLGADGIWLMPIMPSPTYHKYDVTDYYAIDPQYGTLDDFDQLVEAAHARDVKLIIDLVLNHTSNLHPWFDSAVQSLWKGEENKYIGYYNFTTENLGKGYNKITDKYYYECRFVSGMPDLNLSNPEVREEIGKIAQFWLDRGVDGFRLDAATSFYTGDNPKNIEFLTWLNSTIKAYKPDAYLIGEVWSDGGTINEYYKSGIDSFFNFPYSQATGKFVLTLNNQTGADFSKNLADWNLKITQNNAGAIDALFLSNHDNARSAGFLLRSLQKQKMAAAMYLLAPGNPFIYYGEELGMTGSGIDENKRLPMLWSLTDKTGITYPPPNASQTIEGIKGVDEQAADADSLLGTYKHILAIKIRHPEIARGVMTAIETGTQNVAAFSVTYKDKTVYVLHNLSKETQEIDKILFGTKNLKIADFLLTEGGEPNLSSDMITLPPMSTAILR